MRSVKITVRVNENSEGGWRWMISQDSTDVRGGQVENDTGLVISMANNLSIALIGALGLQPKDEDMPALRDLEIEAREALRLSFEDRGISWDAPSDDEAAKVNARSHLRLCPPVPTEPT